MTHLQRFQTIRPIVPAQHVGSSAKTAFVRGVPRQGNLITDAFDEGTAGEPHDLAIRLLQGTDRVMVSPVKVVVTAPPVPKVGSRLPAVWACTKLAPNMRPIAKSPVTVNNIRYFIVFLFS
jgi:hypothetical protein